MIRPFWRKGYSGLRYLLGAMGLVAVVGCAGTMPGAKTAADTAGAQGAETDVKMPVVAPAPKSERARKAEKAFSGAVAGFHKVAGDSRKLPREQCDQVASAFEDVYDDYPEAIDAHFNVGVTWEYCGDAQRAKKIYREVLKKNPKHGGALNNLARMLFAENDDAGARVMFERAAAAKNSEGYTNLARFQRDEVLDGNLQLLPEAVKNVQRALAVNSANVEAYALLATVFYDHAKSLAKLRMARLVCLQATKVDANYPPIYNLLGLILLKMGRVTPALVQFRKAVSQDRDFKEAWMNIGSITLSFRDYSSAEQAFSRVLQLNPPPQMKYEATVGLGVAFRGERKFEQAMTQYKAAQQLDSKQVAILYNMGILVLDYLFDPTDPKKGLQQLEQARGLLQQFADSSQRKTKIRDAERRIRNIDEMVPMLREQQSMMQEAAASTPAADPAPSTN